MNFWEIARRNVNLKSTRLVVTILLLAIGLACISTVNHISSNVIEMVKDEYEMIGENNRMKVTTFDQRAISMEEVEYVKSLKDVETVILDYNTALMLADENQQIIFKSKVQKYDEDLALNVTYMDKGKEGILLPDIYVQDSPNPKYLKDLEGKQIYFMIERTDKDGNAYIEEYKVPVVGIYETKLNQDSATIFVTSELLQQIQVFAGVDDTVYGFDVIVDSEKRIESVAGQVEKIGLDTVYKQKSLKSSIDNVSSFVKLIELFAAIIILLGLIILFLFILAKIKKQEKEVAILKVLGYSNYQITGSIFLEMLIYMLLSSTIGIVLMKILIDILSNKELPFEVVPVSFLSFEVLRMFILNTSVLALLVAAIVIILFLKIKHVNPLRQLKDNQVK